MNEAGRPHFNYKQTGPSSSSGSSGPSHELMASQTRHELPVNTVQYELPAEPVAALDSRKQTDYWDIAATIRISLRFEPVL